MMVALSGFIFASASLEGETITTFPAWNGTSVFAQMGADTAPGQATYGQTFVTPGTNTVLQSFSFWLSDSPSFEPDPMDFAGYLMEWNGARATGPILYQSSMMTADGLAHGQFRRFDFNVGLQLNPAKQYVFFISASQYFDGIPSQAFPGGLAANAYPSGNMASLGNGSDFTQITNANWNQATQWDMVFEASFTPPEPIGPLLRIVRSEAFPSAVLVWPTNAVGYTLQSTTNLSPPVIWASDLPAPVIVSGQYRVTDSFGASQKFYRLRKP